jgi:hypothetical protein
MERTGATSFPVHEWASSSSPRSRCRCATRFFSETWEKGRLDKGKLVNIKERIVVSYCRGDCINRCGGVVGRATGDLLFSS